MPRDDSVYQLMPYEKISKEQYKKMVSTLPKIDFSQILEYEKEDNTEGAKSLACGANGTCEII